MFVKAGNALFINVQHYLNYTTVPYNTYVNRSLVVNYKTVLQNNASYSGQNVMFIVYLQKNNKPTDNSYFLNCTLPNLDPAFLSCARETLNMSTANLSALYAALYNAANLNFYDTLIKVPDRCNRFSTSLRNPWTCMFNSTQLSNKVDTNYSVGVRSIMWNWTIPFANGSYNPNITSPPSPTKTLPYNSKLNLKKYHSVINHFYCIHT